MRMKQLCNGKVWDFETALWAQKFSEAFEILVLVTLLDIKMIKKLDFGSENSCVPVLSVYSACFEDRFLNWKFYFMSVTFGFNFCPRVKKYQVIHSIEHLMVKTSAEGKFQLIKIKAKLHLPKYRGIVIGFRQWQVQAVISLDDKFH